LKNINYKEKGGFTMRHIIFHPATGAIRQVPRRLEENILSYTDPDTGETVVRKGKPYHRDGYINVADPSERQVLRVCREDKEICPAALAWRCGQSDINFSTDQYAKNEKGQNVVVPQNGEVVSITLPGVFEPELSVEAVHDICEDFRIMGKVFPTYSDIFKVKLEESKLTQGIIAFLLESHKQLAEAVAELVGKEAKVPHLPAWIERVMQLRKETRPAGDFGWE